jgi:PmbA protein
MNLEKIAASTLEKMTAQGFEAAQVSVSVTLQDELNIAHNDASLFRSTEDHGVSLKGIVGGRAATAALTDFSDDVLSHEIESLFERAKLAPQDDAQAVSKGQTLHVEKGPQSSDLTLMVDKVKELLAFRAEQSPKMSIDEGTATYYLSKGHLMTSEGSSLSSSVGAYSLSAFGTATDGDQSSSFNYAGGSAEDLGHAHAADQFGIGDMLKETELQISTQPLGDKFVGDVVLAPTAVTDLIGWLLGQLSDGSLIADSSIYKEHVGETIASSLFTLHSRLASPGEDGITGDGFVAEDITVVDKGRLTTLLPSYYGSLKTGIAHRPCASGWCIPAGETAKEAMIGSVKQGALVTRFSMGSPGPSGDFSGVIKNSFVIRDGKVGPALTETMVAGNMAKMLKDIVAISQEHLDTGGEDLPWIQISNMNFS